MTDFATELAAAVRTAEPVNAPAPDLTNPMLAQLAQLLAGSPGQMTDLVRTLQAQTAVEPVPTDLSDDSLAQMLLDGLGGHVHFDPAVGWAVFHPGAHTWSVSGKDGPINEAAATFLRGRRESWTKSLGPNADDKEFARIASLGSTAKRRNVVDAIKALPGVTLAAGTMAETFDQQHDLLAVRNGIVDLRTGLLRPGRPADMITRFVDVDYDPDARAPRWGAFLTEVFPNDAELPAYMQRLIGYGITGYTREQCFVNLYGQGANGKSVLINVLERIFAAFTGRCSFNIFLGDRAGGPESEVLKGARLAVASETNRTAVLNTAAIKEATGGDRLTVMPKYRDPYSYKPTCLIMLATNYLPRIKDADFGTWRRVKVIPFEARFERDQRDEGLEDFLVSEEAAGILAWAVQGSVQWFAEGLSDTASMAAAAEDYQRESDPLDGFLEQTFKLDDSEEGKGVKATTVFQAYGTWAAALGDPMFKQSQTLNSALLERYPSLSVKRTKAGRVIVGIRELTPAEQHGGPTGPGVMDGSE
ncbi:phage/plasmid primase, P4 family [Streptomyces ovatisporus]|uniref:Phage/plasmid primase, P4 family n=1 Tax=Streptomyces ovatisporus TaxID=1128682 RepID=A0ABV9A8P4_9ACTN